ncbi:MAG: tRNA pseudouridine(55) synthase TruB [Betaproteobacteria bacterium]|nr:tRNA pseudouridine(55) synthase TruB [Betaproteobacteria bacterium]MBP6465233.1 tRNA pseudouridine(55) synthase TruB [Rubrivivax sp.]
MTNPVPRPRQPRRPLHGVLLLDKPIGWTSNDALQKAKGLLRAEKGGHTGTLDPLATGLLPLCFGAATKFSQASLDADKSYRATLKLGQRTSTGDREGEVVETRPVQVERAAIAAACARFVGPIEQLPPMHSALKHEGRALYDYARAGVEVDRSTRRITIHRIDIVDWQHDCLVIDVCCSKGTYIRTLAEDIGTALGCGAHLQDLRRTASGSLNVNDAVTIEALAAMDEAAREARLLPSDVLLSDWPAVHLPNDEAGRFLTGLRRRVALADTPAVRVYGPAGHPQPQGHEAHAFLGTAHITAGELIADRLLSPLEVQALQA